MASSAHNNTFEKPSISEIFHEGLLTKEELENFNAWDAIDEINLQIGADDHVLTHHPSSCEDFTSRVARFLTPSATQAITAAVSQFNELVGDDGELADAIIEQDSCKTWLFSMMFALRAFQPPGRRGVASLREYGFGRSRQESGQREDSSGEKDKRSSSMPQQEDVGPSGVGFQEGGKDSGNDSDISDLQNPSPNISFQRCTKISLQKRPARNDGKTLDQLWNTTWVDEIVQINLRGTDLKQAWVANHQWALPNLLVSLTPSTSSTFHTFHGTNAMNLVLSPEKTLDVHPFMTMGIDCGDCKRNELCPNAAFYTSYHPLRSILWGIFRSTIATSIVRGSAKQCLEQRWTWRGKEFHGIILFEFKFNSPSSSGTSNVVVSGSIVDDWADYLRKLGLRKPVWYEENTTDCWHYLKKALSLTPDVHKGLEKWPDFIHASEDKRTVRALRGFFGPPEQGLLGGKIWRTAACTAEAVDIMNNSLVKVYALSFEQTDAPTSLAPSSPQVSDQIRASPRAAVAAASASASASGELGGDASGGRGILRRLRQRISKFKLRDAFRPPK